MAELVEMRPQCVHRLGTLLHKLLTCPKRDGARLLFRRFRLYEPHGRPQRCLDDCLSVGGVILLPLDERLDVMRRD